MARLLLGVSGGIAAYKALETARLAVKHGHAVRVIQTSASTRFIGTASFEAITGARVLIDEFEPDPLRGGYPGEALPERSPISHLALVERADLYLIAPASANTIAKLAGGHADNLLSAAALAAACPVAVAPAMNERMYIHPATQANLEVLKARGVSVIPPGQGDLASHGEHGIGRLAEPAELLAASEALLAAVRGSWAGVRALVTAGGTREPIDSVRYIGNRSSGRMGFALAAEAAARGAAVTLLAANAGLEPPPGARVIEVSTAAELARACEREFDACDVLLMAAAVADFRPAAPAHEKLKKEAGVPPPIELEPTEDVLSALAARKRPDQILVGFAAEHGDRGVSSGAEKLQRKRLDAVVVNDISKPGVGFDSSENEVTIVAVDGTRHTVARAGKERIARAVLDDVERLLAERGTDERREGSDGASGPGTRSAARV
jgi:phosphopantothenoylcysteine decarboxylase/phosphopantothenate--cysteine ligase